MSGSGHYERRHRHFVGRRHHYETRKRARQAKILDAHLRRTVLTDRDAAMRSHYLEVCIAVGRRNTKLLEALIKNEAGETCHEWDLAGGCQSRANGYHVRLGNSA